MLDEREDSTFGALLRSFRVQRGLNQLGLARKLGMQTRDTISAWERHLYLPDKRDKVMQIANALSLNDQQRNQLLFATGYALESQKGPEVQAPATRVEYMVVEHMEIPSTIPVSPEAKRCDCYQHIALPINYVVRRDLLETVIALLSSRVASVALTSAVKGKPAALHGMGGIGKSVIARALCDEQAVQQAFPDGILWATLGQTPNLPELLRSWIEVLGGRISENAPTVESLKRLLAGLLKLWGQ